jgi:hypothetical protein
MNTWNLTFIFLLSMTPVLGTNHKEMTRVVGGIAFINKMYTETDLARMIKHYVDELHQVLSYPLRAQNDLLSILREVAHLDFKLVQLGDVKPEELDNLSPWVHHYLSYVLGNRPYVISKWKSLLKEVWFAAVARAQGGPIEVDELLNDHQIKTSFDDYTTQFPKNFRNDGEKKKFLDDLIDIRQKLFADLSIRYSQIREFREDPLGAVSEILDRLITYHMVDSSDKDSDPSIPTTIAALNEFLLPVEGYKRVERSVRMVINALNGEYPRTSDVRIQTAAALMKLFVHASKAADIRIGKVAFLFYFRGTSYGPKYSAEYLNFLITKYRKEHLRFSFPDVTKGYPDLLRTYTVDMLSTSMQVSQDFIRPTDLEYVFGNYLYFAAPFKRRTFTAIDEMKGLFEVNKELLLEHYELFNALYDTVIFSGDYLQSWNIGSWQNIPGLFDDFLNSLFSWQKGRILPMVWEWEPEVPYFAINIKTNYAFYKLVNLVAHMDELSDRDITFAKFLPNDDFLIHRFTLVPKYRQFTFFLKKKLGLRGFNYHRFAEKTVSASMNRAYRKYEKEHDIAKSKVA